MSASSASDSSSVSTTRQLRARPGACREELTPFTLFTLRLRSTAACSIASIISREEVAVGAGGLAATADVAADAGAATSALERAGGGTSIAPAAGVAASDCGGTGLHESGSGGRHDARGSGVGRLSSAATCAGFAGVSWRVLVGSESNKGMEEELPSSVRSCWAASEARFCAADVSSGCRREAPCCSRDAYIGERRSCDDMYWDSRFAHGTTASMTAGFTALITWGRD